MAKAKELGVHPMITAAVIDKMGKKKEAKQQRTAVTGRSAADVNLEIYEAEGRRKRKNNIAKGVGVIIGGFIVYKVGKKIISNITDRDDSPEVQYAKRIRVAMSPSGIWWIPDGTNEKAIMKVAREIADNEDVDFSNVQTAYKRLYGKSLSKHLEGELDTPEYTKFLKIVSPDYDPEKDKERSDYFKYGKAILIINDTSLYKDKGSYGKLQTLQRNSIFTNAVTTGREWTVVDVVTGGILFKQRRIEIKKVNGNTTRWLNAADIGTKEIQMPMSQSLKNALTKKGFKLYQIS